MDTSNWRPDQGGSGGGDNPMESVDWRTQLPADFRQKLVLKICDTLKRLPFLPVKPHQLQDVATKFEQKTYNTATNHSDYMRKISIKLLGIQKDFENRSANPMPNSAGSSVSASDLGSQGIKQENNQGQSLPIHALPPGTGLSQSNIPTQNPSLHNIQQNSLGSNNSMGQGIPSNSFVNQRQMPARQQQQNSPQYIYRQQLHQIAKPNYSATSAQSHIHQQQHHNLLQSAQKQQRQQQLQTSATNLQRNHLMGQQNNNLQLSHQHSVGQHNNFSVMHQQHVGPPQSSSTGQQHSAHVMQPKPQQNQSVQGQRPQTDLQVMSRLQTQSGQMQRHLNMKPQPNLSQQQRIPTSSAFQQQSVIDQQKSLFQIKREMPEASSTSSDSTAQTGNPNSGDWQEEVYQKIKCMKDKYMPELSDIYQKLIDRLQQPKNEQLEKVKTFKQTVEHYMAYLQVSKTKISPAFKEKLSYFEAQLIHIITTSKRKPGPHPQQPLPMPHQQAQPHDNLMNSTMFQLQNPRQMHQKYIPKHLLQQQQQQNQQINQQPKQLQLIQPPHINMKMEPLQRSQLKSGPPFSPQIPSPNIDQQNNSVTKSGTGTPMQSANSPFTMSSPSTPSTSHVVGESEKVNSGISSLSNAGNIGHQQNAVVQSLPSGTPGISASPLLAEFASPDGNNGSDDALVVSGKSTTIEEPIDRLLKAVKSISEKCLSASVSEIDSVVSMIECIAGSRTLSQSQSGDDPTSKEAIGEDLVAATKCHLQSRTRKMKRPSSTMPSIVVSSASTVHDSFHHFNCLEASELESTATSTIKRPRIQKTNALLEEIRGINKRLIDSVVDISEEDIKNTAGSLEVGKGSVVVCSYRAVTLSPNIKSQYASGQMSIIQPLRLLVPSNYPNSSPTLLDKFLIDDSKELNDLSMKAKRRFCSYIRRLSEPMSLEEMASTWGVCARAVISDYAQQNFGGGTFTSKYGAWEDCTIFNAA